MGGVEGCPFVLVDGGPKPRNQSDHGDQTQAHNRPAPEPVVDLRKRAV